MGWLILSILGGIVGGSFDKQGKAGSVDIINPNEEKRVGTISTGQSASDTLRGQGKSNSLRTLGQSIAALSQAPAETQSPFLRSGPGARRRGLDDRGKYRFIMKPP